jgi:hypothetical protein
VGDDRIDGGEILADLQAEAGELEPPADWQTPDTLGSDLVDVVDDIRAIAADLGLRPYRVFLMHARWTGGERGAGKLLLVAEREIVPPPRVQDVSGMAMVLRSTGVTEEGDVKVDEVSARFSEDDLVGLTPDMVDPQDPRRLRPDVEFFYEMRESRDTARPTVRRRFVLANTPSLSRDGMQWTISLLRQDGDRMRDGSTTRDPGG